MSEATTLLRRLAAQDPHDAGLRRDLLAVLVQRADVIRLVDPQGATTMYREARMLARAAVESSRDAQADRELTIIEDRLNGLTFAAQKTELKLFSLSNGRMLPIDKDLALPVDVTNITAVATAPEGWSRYVVVFGAEGAGTIFDESELTRMDWKVPILGPPPAQTILLLAYPRSLTVRERNELRADIEAIPGPRTIDWDSQIVWASDAEPQILTTATARGQRSREWIKLVQAKLRKLKGVRFAGRTIPIPASISGARPHNHQGAPLPARRQASHGSHAAAMAAVTGASERAICSASARGSSNAIGASPMSRSRLTFPSSQRLTSRRTDAGVECGQRRQVQVLTHYRGERVADVFPLERPACRRHLERHVAARQSVAPFVGDLALSCPGDMHAVRRNTHLSHGGSRDGRRHRRAARGGLHRLGEAKVQHFRREVRTHLDVAGFKIAMDDPALVGRFDGLCDLLREG